MTSDFSMRETGILQMFSSLSVESPMRIVATLPHPIVSGSGEGMAHRWETIHLFPNTRHFTFFLCLKIRSPMFTIFSTHVEPQCYLWLSSVPRSFSINIFRMLQYIFLSCLYYLYCTHNFTYLQPYSRSCCCASSLRFPLFCCLSHVFK